MVDLGNFMLKMNESPWPVKWSGGLLVRCPRIFFVHSCGTVFGEISTVPVREPYLNGRIETSAFCRISYLFLI